MINTSMRCVMFGITRLGVLLIALLCSSVILASDLPSTTPSDYSQGMRAYMANDFERAQVHWLNAAKTNDARSMFNLGLLHEQERISGAELSKAQNWYRLAGEHGYAAADYHLAKLIMSNSSQAEAQSDVVQTLLTKSANNNFAPAQQLLVKLNVVAAPPVIEEISTDRAIADVSKPVEATDATEKSKYLNESWIAQKKPTDWTIQILAFNDKAKVQAFIDRYNLNDSASYFIDRSQSEVLYKLVYGLYGSKEQAATARDNLSPELKVHGPWLRTIASVQAVISVE